MHAHPHPAGMLIPGKKEGLGSCNNSGPWSAPYGAKVIGWMYANSKQVVKPRGLGAKGRLPKLQIGHVNRHCCSWLGASLTEPHGEMRARPAARLPGLQQGLLLHCSLSWDRHTSENHCINFLKNPVAMLCRGSLWEIKMVAQTQLPGHC